MSKYQDIMNELSVSEEMEERIVRNIREADIVKKKKNVYYRPALAAAFVIVLAVIFVPRLQMGSASSTDYSEAYSLTSSNDEASGETAYYDGEIYTMEDLEAELGEAIVEPDIDYGARDCYIEDGYVTVVYYGDVTYAYSLCKTQYVDINGMEVTDTLDVNGTEVQLYQDEYLTTAAFTNATGTYITFTAYDALTPEQIQEILVTIVSE